MCSWTHDYEAKHGQAHVYAVSDVKTPPEYVLGRGANYLEGQRSPYHSNQDPQMRPYKYQTMAERHMVSERFI